jgi:hypothetical protein
MFSNRIVSLKLATARSKIRIWAQRAPAKADLLLRAGKPVEALDFQPPRSG